MFPSIRYITANGHSTIPLPKNGKASSIAVNAATRSANCALNSDNMIRITKNAITIKIICAFTYPPRYILHCVFISSILFALSSPISLRTAGVNRTSFDTIKKSARINIIAHIIPAGNDLATTCAVSITEKSAVTAIVSLYIPVIALFNTLRAKSGIFR